ncbi:MAG TPA: class I SAM-dependent methyltransferase [Kribbella sp.]|uniref:class I SAM-dependent methyltransferase n=1 Tax=Kribbella sp. TaxID=1871183 RepID=UPI002D772372|nr:class I SAM-dependent methyltransferase [Kribbella sp.]HET6296651.1 class I SAM-dependent methyltransferase [Kribbella sp.]
MTPVELMVERSRQIWNAGVDYQPIATQEVLVSELLARAADVHWGEAVLDVAAGTGNTALAAARRGGRVTAVDLGVAGLEMAQSRAAIEGVEVKTELADLQELPFADDTFDVVLSTFGTMYGPDQQKTADELVRVCRPGGRLGLVSWCPSGWMADLQSALGEVLPPPPFALPAPHLWGTVEQYPKLFGDRIRIESSTVLTQEFCGESAESQTKFMLDHLPPWQLLQATLDPGTRAKLVAAIEGSYERANRATDGTLQISAEYLQLVATIN